MALRKCKDCGTDVSKRAETCPQCGAPLKRKPINISCGGCLLLLIGVMVIGTMSLGDGRFDHYQQGSSEPETVDPNEGVRGAGYEIAKRIVTPELKAPSTAEYPWGTVEFSVMPDYEDESGAKAGRWLVRGAVDAQNAFGATIRSWWEMILLRRGGQFFPVHVQFEEREIYRASGYL